MAIFKSKFYPFHTSQKNRVSNVAVKVAVTKNLVAVKGPQVAVVSGGSGSEGLPGSGNPGWGAAVWSSSREQSREGNAKSGGE